MIAVANVECKYDGGDRMVRLSRYAHVYDLAMIMKMHRNISEMK